MNCRELEARLERLLAGDLSGAERRRCERHLGACAECRELEALARLAEPAPAAAGLLAEILARTSGGACAAAREHLCDRADGGLSAVEGELVEVHLGGCPECEALAGALSALRRDLPALADVAPGTGFVSAVMRRTLPWRLRLLRWWERGWPRWVRRPRFAAEAAYVATLVLVLIFATPVSPLEAMPERVVELARTPPTSHLTAPLERLKTRAEAGLEAAHASEAAGAAAARWERTLELTARAVDRSVELAGEAREKVRTFRDRAASLLQRAGEDPPAPSENSEQETS